MKIEAVVTFVDYADFLAESLPHNKGHFDRLVVVTSHEDLATQEVCGYWGVRCVQTDAFESRWGRFRKGAGINEGLAELDRDGWLVHMDADIVLPPMARRMLEMVDLRKDSIYGIDRHICHGYEAWRKFMSRPRPQHEQEIFVHTDPFPVGVRIASWRYGGYVPIGFFQLWHASTGRTKYPDEHTDAARGDMLFALQWERAKRALIPEIIGYHIESEAAPMGANWKGRKTKRFGPDAEGYEGTAAAD